MLMFVGKLPCTVYFTEFWCMNKVTDVQQNMKTALNPGCCNQFDHHTELLSIP